MNWVALGCCWKVFPFLFPKSYLLTAIGISRSVAKREIIDYLFLESLSGNHRLSLLKGTVCGPGTKGSHTCDPDPISPTKGNNCTRNGGG